MQKKIFGKTCLKHENRIHMQQQNQPLKVFQKIDVTKRTVKAYRICLWRSLFLVKFLYWDEYKQKMAFSLHVQSK